MQVTKKPGRCRACSRGAMFALAALCLPAEAQLSIKLEGILDLSSVYGQPGVGVGPDGASFDGQQGYVWLVDSSSKHVHAVKPETGTVVADFPADAGFSVPFPEGIAWIPGGELYVIHQGTPNNSSPAAIVRFDTAGILNGEQRIAYGNSGIGLDTAAGLLRISNDISNEIENYVFDPGFNAMVLQSTLSLGPLGIADPEAVEVDPATGNLLIVDDQNDVLVEATPGGIVLQTVDLAAVTGLQDPEGLALDPVNRLLYVAFDDDVALATFTVDLPAPEATAVPLPDGALAAAGLIFALSGGVACRRLRTRGGRHSPGGFTGR